MPYLRTVSLSCPWLSKWWTLHVPHGLLSSSPLSALTALLLVVADRYHMHNRCALMLPLDDGRTLLPQLSLFRLHRCLRNQCVSLMVLVVRHVYVDNPREPVGLCGKHLVFNQCRHYGSPTYAAPVL